MKRYYIFLGCLVAVLPLDQITKYLIDGAVALHQSIVVIPGFFNITYVRNPGAAFGFLAGAPSFVRSLFLIVLSLAAMALILYYLIRSASRDLLMSTALSLVFSGAVGNLIDRIRFGEVIDFLDFHIGAYHWPAFNVADSAISAGAVLILYGLARKGTRVEGKQI